MQANQQKSARPSSRQRYSELQRQQRYLADVFKLDNFYQDEKLNLLSLKSRLDQVRGRIKLNNSIADKEVSDMLVPLSRKINHRENRLGTARIPEYGSTRGHTSSTLDNDFKFTSHFNPNETRSKQLSKTPYVDPKEARPSRQKSPKQSSLMQAKSPTNMIKSSRGESSWNSANKHHRHLSSYYGRSQEKESNTRQGPRVHSIGHRKNFADSSQTIKSKQRILSHLQPLHKRPISKIQLSAIDTLRKFQARISTIWQLYQKLSSISQTLSASNNPNQLFSQPFIKLLTSYKETVCSNQLQFVGEVARTCLETPQMKVVLTSRLLQSLSVVYVFLEIVEKTFIQQLKSKDKRKQQREGRDKSMAIESSHLVNFVGLCSNNLLLLLRVITLTHNVASSLELTRQTQQIFDAITEYEARSFQNELVNLRDVMIRMEHNNSTISLVESKLNSKMISSGQYHTNCIGNFMRGVIIDCLKLTDRGQNQQVKPFYEYSYFIFEYLSYHLHHEQCIGLFPREIQTAPAPYLPLTKEFTIVINPVGTLLYERKQKIYVRAHTDYFLRELTDKFNVVLWSDQMPNSIDPLFDIIAPHSVKKDKDGKFLPSSFENEKIKRLYRHHCIYEGNGTGYLVLVKDISRIGCPENKYLIIDSNHHSYPAEDELFCINMPWKGQSHDNRLLTLLDLLLPFLREGTDLSRGMRLLKPRLDQLLRGGTKNKANRWTRPAQGSQPQRLQSPQIPNDSTEQNGTLPSPTRHIQKLPHSQAQPQTQIRHLRAASQDQNGDDLGQQVISSMLMPEERENNIEMSMGSPGPVINEQGQQ